jgi:hypothetical protein
LIDCRPVAGGKYFSDIEKTLNLVVFPMILNPGSPPSTEKNKG